MTSNIEVDVSVQLMYGTLFIRGELSLIRVFSTPALSKVGILSNSESNSESEQIENIRRLSSFDNNVIVLDIVEAY